MEGGDTRERQRELCTTMPYAEVVGDPIEHSRSPDIHRAWIKEAGIDGDYRATRVQPHEFKDYLDERRQDPAWRGCNVTAPLKELALPFVDELSQRAKAIGAINIIARRDGRLVGDNSDVDGIAAAVPQQLVSGKTAILIGAGGAARAALHYLEASGIAKVQVMARNPARAVAMHRSIDEQCAIIVTGLGGRRFVNPAIVINASPVGMVHAPTPETLVEMVAGLDRKTLMFDMVYDPVETELLKAARHAGLRTAGGLTMLSGQASAAFRSFFGEARLDERANDRFALGAPKSAHLAKGF